MPGDQPLPDRLHLAHRLRAPLTLDEDRAGAPGERADTRIGGDIGRRDEMMKTSGYRVSPTEVEEILYATGLVGECIAFGVPNPALGQAVCVIATGKDAYPLDAARLLSECRQRMPTYMVPAVIDVREGPLPRNPNGKIDRRALPEPNFSTGTDYAAPATETEALLCGLFRRLLRSAT